MIEFDMVEDETGLYRKSHEGPIEMDEGLPLNPMGRTGVQGRGALYRWGPNHCVDPVVTRWLRDIDGHIMREDGKQVLEFVAIKRADNGLWAIPGVGAFLEEPLLLLFITCFHYQY